MNLGGTPKKNQFYFFLYFYNFNKKNNMANYIYESK
jgi:hypothetical protein